MFGDDLGQRPDSAGPASYIQNVRAKQVVTAWLGLLSQSKDMNFMLPSQALQKPEQPGSNPILSAAVHPAQRHEADFHGFRRISR